MTTNKPTFESKPRQAAWDVNYSREWIRSNTKAGAVYGNFDITHLFIEAHGETVESISSEDYYGTHNNLCAALEQCCSSLKILSHTKDDEGGNVFTRH